MMSSLYADYQNGVSKFYNINFERDYIYPTGDASGGWYTVCGEPDPAKATANCVDSNGLGSSKQNLQYSGTDLQVDHINYPYGAQGVKDMR